MVEPRPVVDYRRADPWRGARRVVRLVTRITVWSIGGLMLLIVLALGAFMYTGRAAEKAFEAKTNVNHLAGQSPQQVIALLGPPYFDERPGLQSWRPAGEFMLVYSGGWGRFAKINFERDVATSVDYYSK